jgi:hypothetical protein
VGIVVAVAALFLLVNVRRRTNVSIDVTADDVTVSLHGWDALYCLRRRLTVPRTAVAGVCVGRQDRLPREWMRLPGTAIPGLIRAGSYGAATHRDFWDVRRAAEVLVIELVRDAGPYRRIVLEVADPHAEARRLQPDLGAAVLTGSVPN